MNQELSDFAAQLRYSIASGFQKENFESLALELFALQFKFNSAYRKFCEARKLTSKIIGHWTQIPFVPAGAFKELELTSLAQDERTAVFHSSGTTEQRPGRHFHCVESLELYETSLWKWFEDWNLESGIQNSELICLTPPPEFAPNSSLVHMFETIRKKMNAPKNIFVGKISSDGWVLNFDAAFAAVNSVIANRRSVIVFGTAFSFVHLLDYLAENNLRLQLPENSHVMETGGYKNRSRELPKAELHSLVAKFLGVPHESIFCEYGMSELGSQAYAKSSGKFHFPPWARMQLISPETGREAAEGEAGLIRVFDLANVFSIAAIQTEDLGGRCGDGFELMGRAPLAEPRGCSLMSVEGVKN